MLRMLSIQNIAIAENLVVDFDSGLNIITGETGAGKSILVDALSLLRGGKVDIGLIRDGAEAAHVAASFHLPVNSRTFGLLEELGIAPDADEPRLLSVRRSLSRSQKHRGYVNDVPVSTRVLQQVTADLIDISSQFENQRLLESEAHTRYLDHFSGLADTAAAFGKGYARYQALVREIASLEEERALRKRERELFEFELTQIDEGALSEAEWSSVQETLALGNKASSAQRIIASLNEALTDGEVNCLQLVRACHKSVERLVRLAAGVELKLRPERLEELSSLVEDIAYETQQTLSQFDIDEEKLQNAFARAEVYNRLLQKFGPSLADVHSHRERCVAHLERDVSLGGDVARLAKEAARVAEELVALASKLSEGRRKNRGGLAKAVMQELGELGMAKARFVCSLVDFEQATLSAESEGTQPALATPVVLQSVPADVAAELSEAVRKRFTRLTRHGFERAQFLMSANLGLEPQPIERVASGGELSRTMLAIKSVLFEQESMSLFVFDEIDTGISGAIAAKVGRKLAEFCAARQALCITHLPQVACFARAHYVVSKQHTKTRTVARIAKATPEETLRELASMISGEEVTPESLAHARALVREARGQARPSHDAPRDTQGGRAK
ncbi:MAG: DNA repair protein RecN [Silvanigrellales bacterium]|nr:DNA repair protein RecN [Silvanigrellales bacterium]